MMRFGLGLLLGIAAATVVAAESVDSRYTGLSGPPACEVSAQDEAIAASQLRCEGVAGYRLVVADDDSRMSLTVVTPEGANFPLDLWSLVGSAFSALGEKAEWRGRGAGDAFKPFALIVRFNTENPETAEPISYLTVSKITPKRICLTEVIPPTAEQNEQARAAAERAPERPCLADSAPR